MRYVFASDLHGSASAGQLLLEAFQREKADRLVLLGDILAGGNPGLLASLLNEFAPKIWCVCGNCDRVWDQDYLDFSILTEKLIFQEADRLFVATHGHIWGDGFPPEDLPQGSVLICGHTHVPSWHVHPDYIYVNPGSAARPRHGSEQGYLLYDDGNFFWKDMEGNVYMQKKLPN